MQGVLQGRVTVVVQISLVLQSLGPSSSATWKIFQFQENIWEFGSENISPPPPPPPAESCLSTGRLLVLLPALLVIPWKIFHILGKYFGIFV